MAESVTVQKTTFVYDTQGVEQTKQKVDQLAGSLDKLAGSQGKATDAEGKSSASSDKAVQARARIAAAQERFQRQIEMEARAMAMAQAAQDASAASLQGLSDAQMRAVQSSAALQSASNDNVAAMEKQSSAFKEAGKWVAEHPTLVLAGSVLAARALSGLAATAAVSLRAASVSTAGYAAVSAEMGGAVVAGATVAARGLGIASTAAGLAATGLGKYAETVSGLTTMIGLLTRGLSVLPGVLGPIGIAFLVFETAKSAISQAGEDLERLIALGEKARSLDIAAPFVKSFEDLGKKIGATTDQMDKALQTASSFVKEKYGQANGALQAVSGLYTSGAFGAEKPVSMSALETATTTQEKVQATLDAIKELQARGQDFAALDLTEKLFGPELVERIRQGQTTIAQFAVDLQAASEKEVLKQEQVDRALELNKNITDTKQAISDAVAVTFDFSNAAMMANEAWLKVLQTVLSVISQINAANQAASDFVGTTTTTMIEGLKKAGSAAADLAAGYGLIAKKKAEAEVQGPPEAAGPPEQKITAKQFPYTFGPGLENLPKATGAAKQAQQAAQEAASSYDLLIKRTEDRIDELKLEAQTVGQTTDAVIKLKLAHDLERAAQKDGTTVTQSMRDDWDKLGDRVATATNNLHDAKRAFEGIRDGKRELAGDLSTFADDLVLGGQKLSDAFAGLSKTLGSGSLKALLTGEGPLAGILGTQSAEKGQIGGLLGGKLDFGGLFNSDKIADALGVGAETGLGKSISSYLKESKPGGGFFSSQLGQGLAAVGAGASVGYTSQNPLIGGLSGALTGAMSGNPYLAVAGGIAGIAGGACGHKPSRKKDRDHERSERLRAFAACCAAD